MKVLFISLILICALFSQSFQTHFEKSNMLESVNPYKVMDLYEQLAARYDFIKIVEAGMSDAQWPIYTVIISKKKIFEAKDVTNEMVFLIQNGIHSGESGGIDASQMIVRDYAEKIANSDDYDELILVVIPVFSIGGQLKFSPYNRVNQTGPKEMGFRGNARNYNLNRDYMKMDTKNLEAYADIFHSWNPQVFLDNHCTNGADYQDAMTYMINDQDMDRPAVRDYIKNDFLKFMEEDTKDQDWPISPYVNLKTRHKIEDGIDFYRLPPRFSTGYTALFNKISILVETHMIKPYKDRVLSNYAFMNSIIKKIVADKVKIQQIIKQSDDEVAKLKRYTLLWKKNYDVYDEIEFRGYAYEKKHNELYNGPLTKYLRDQPKTYKIKHYNRYTPDHTIEVPEAYIIPQEWHEVIDRLKRNKVEMTRVDADMNYDVEMYRFSNPKFATRPYEGRFRLNSFDLKTEKSTRMFRKGHYVVKMNQRHNAYIMEALEPRAFDSFVSWGLFHTIFQKHEYFSPYLFVDRIDAIFKADPQLKKDFEEKVKSDPDFAKNSYQRFNFIYQRSPYYEKHTYMLYPVARLMAPTY